jgi:hypothetical protein
VAYVRVAGLVRPRLVAHGALPCETSEGEERWRGAVRAFAAAMAPLRGDRLAVTVVLSNSFVRYAVVPFDAAVSGDDEELAVARFHFQRVHGDRVRDWELRISPGPHGTARLASGIDPGLIAAIRAGLPRGARARLASVQPYLMAAYNRCARDASRRGAWLMLVEPGFACAALALRDGWLAAQPLRLSGSESSGWIDLLEREHVRLGAPGPRSALVQGAPSLLPSSGWQTSPLPEPPLRGGSAAGGGRYAMALSAL